MVSEAVDIPGHSYSEDFCSLEVQGSLHSADLSPYCITPKEAAEQSCSALDRHTHCRFHRTHSEGFPDEGDSSHSRASTDRSQGQKKNCAHGRSLDCSSGNYSPSERELQRSAQESSATPPLQQKKPCSVDFSQPLATFQTSPCFGPANTSPCAGGREAAVQQQHDAKHPASTIVRSSSAPVSCSAASEGRWGTTGQWMWSKLLIGAAIGAAGNYIQHSKEGCLRCEGFSSMHIFWIWNFLNGNGKIDRVKLILAFLNLTIPSAHSGNHVLNSCFCVSVTVPLRG